MNLFPLKYEEPLFRPPSEAYSLILQITIGCSWNKCAFCEMYSKKKFRIRDPEEIIDEIKKVSLLDNSFRKIFLAAGDAMVLSAKKLKKILDAINKYFPKIRRISAYAKSKNLANKSIEDLELLKNAGLNLLYIGIETGDDELLKLINKDETFKTTANGILKAKQAGIKSSVMILNGLGGKKYSLQHAKKSAELINLIQPEYLSTLVLSFPFGQNHYIKRFDGEYISMNTIDLIKEMRIFIENTNLKNTIFRSDHASNYLVLKGILYRDKEKLLRNINFVLNNPKNAILRPESSRSL